MQLHRCCRLCRSCCFFLPKIAEKIIMTPPPLLQKDAIPFNKIKVYKLCCSIILVFFFWIKKYFLQLSLVKIQKAKIVLYVCLFLNVKKQNRLIYNKKKIFFMIFIAVMEIKEKKKKLSFIFKQINLYFICVQFK